MSFPFWVFWVSWESFDFSEIVQKFLLVIWYCQGTQLVSLQKAPLDCQFQPYWANALEYWSNVPVEISSIFGCNLNIVHELSTFISFINSVQVLTHETWKCRHISAKTLGKGSTSKVECRCFHWASVRHLQIVIRLGPIKRAEETLPCEEFCCFW